MGWGQGPFLNSLMCLTASGDARGDAPPLPQRHAVRPVARWVQARSLPGPLHNSLCVCGLSLARLHARSGIDTVPVTW